MYIKLKMHGKIFYIREEHFENISTKLDELASEPKKSWIADYVIMDNQNHIDAEKNRNFLTTEILLDNYLEISFEVEINDITKTRKEYVVNTGDNNPDTAVDILKKIKEEFDNRTTERIKRERPYPWEREEDKWTHIGPFGPRF